MCTKSYGILRYGLSGDRRSAVELKAGPKSPFEFIAVEVATDEHHPVASRSARAGGSSSDRALTLVVTAG
jgi:hypothetical protein